MDKLCVDRLVRLPVDVISPAPGQARRVFSQQSIEELAASIKKYGLLSPICVRKCGSGFELVAGERRLRAVALLGEKTIFALVRPSDAREAALLGLMENLQREQLKYLEVAEGLRALISTHGFSQEALGKMLGLSQSSVANKLRLLGLSESVRCALMDSDLSERHARALLRLEGEDAQLRAIKRAREGALSVRQTEDMIARMIREKPEKRRYRIYLRDRRMLVNAVLDVVKSLNQAGVMATSRVENYSDRVEVTVTLPVAEGAGGFHPNARLAEAPAN